MEEPHLIKCESESPADEEDATNFVPNPLLPHAHDTLVEIKVEPCNVCADENFYEVEASTVMKKYEIQPCEDIKEEISIEQDTVDELVPRVKKENNTITTKTKGGQGHRTEQVIDSQLHIEDKLEVLDAMLSPLPEKARKVKKEPTKRRKEEKDGEEKEEYVCDLCGASFARAAQYYGHLQSHSGEHKWECTLCPTPVEFPSQSQLWRHEKQCHLNLRSHQCSLGQLRKMEQVIESELHIEDRLEVLDAMLTPLPEKARKVKKETRKRRKKDKDGEEKQEYVCDLCGASFARAVQYYGHLHSHSGERKWECTLCPTAVEFPSQSQLRRHEKQCHLNLRPHECSLCSACFDRASQLNYHERRIHAGEKPHKCQICLKGFFKRSDLRTHLSIHLGINKSICEVCGKKFNHVSHLIRHTRIHSGIKPYPCRVCGKRFTQLSTMLQHKVSHQVEKDVKHMLGDKETSNISSRTKESGHTRCFYCNVCGESFEFTALLKEHERKHEKETSFHCQCCKQDFTSVDLLKMHSCQTPEERLQKEAEAEAVGVLVPGAEQAD